MFLLDGVVVFSASDLVRAAACEFAVMRDLDTALGWCEAPESVADPVLYRTTRDDRSRLGRGRPGHLRPSRRGAR